MRFCNCRIWLHKKMYATVTKDSGFKVNFFSFSHVKFQTIIVHSATKVCLCRLLLKSCQTKHKLIRWMMPKGQWHMTNTDLDPDPNPHHMGLYWTLYQKYNTLWTHETRYADPQPIRRGMQSSWNIFHHNIIK